jgi:hypothetical protein
MGTLGGAPIPSRALAELGRAQLRLRGRRRPARGATIKCLLIGLLATTSATAEPRTPIDLRWEAPSGCPQEADVRNRIEKILGSGRHDSPLRAEGTITRIDGRFQLDLVVHVGDVAGTRSIVAKSCEDLAGAAAVEIGLLVHSVEATGTRDRTGNQTPTPAPVGESETSGSGADGTSGIPSQGTDDAISADRAPSGPRSERKTEVDGEAEEQPPRPETPRRWHALVQAPLVALGVGPLPPLATGLGLSLGFEYEAWQLRLQGLSWRHQNAPASGFPGYGIDVDRMGAALWVCRELRSSWFGFAPCLTAGMERVSARGTGSNILPTTRHTIAVSAGAGLQGRIHLASWIRLLAAVSGEVELVRPQFLVERLGALDPDPELEEPDPPTPVYRFAPAAFTATLGLEWAL